MPKKMATTPLNRREIIMLTISVPGTSMVIKELAIICMLSIRN